MLTYRPEIDGLRAIAVIPVIFFHANIPFFWGGFIGVDVFFVISGYLICNIILSDLEKNQFSLINFYNRRMRRILPALITVIFTCFPMAFWVMAPYQMESFAKSALAALAFVSNIFFFFEDSYFSESEIYKPLLHTWSLAVEEQFYLIFPIFMMLFWQFGKKTLLCLILSVSVLSILLTQWGGNLNFQSPYIEEDLLFFNQPVWADFYLPIGRTWELGIGAITAIILRNRRIPVNTLTDLAAIVGLLLIVYSVAVIDLTTPWPGFYTLIPVTATVLLILFAQQNTIAGKILSSRILVSIGLISYSLYLWHQPIFAFLRVQIPEGLSTSLITIAIAACFTLAFFSWRFIEQPFRVSRKITTKHAFICLSTSCLCLGLLAAAVVKTNGFINRIDPHNLDLVNTSPFERGKYVGHNFWYMRKFDFPNKPGKKIVIVGDSFAQDFVNVVRENSYLENQNVVTFSLPLRCFTYLQDPNLADQNITANFKNCRDEYSLAKGINLMQNSDVTIFSFAWNSAQIGTIEAVRSGLKSEHQKKIIFLGPKSFGHVKINSLTELPLEDRPSYKQHVTLSNVPKMLVQAGVNSFIDLQKLICSEDYNCPVFTPDGLLISYDGMHLTKAGAKFLGPQIFSHGLLLPLLEEPSS